MVSRIIGILIVALLIAGAAWAVWPRPVEVEAVTVAQGDFVVTIDEEGIARIREVFRVTAPVGGRLVRVNLHAGDAVKIGETVATIEPAAPALLDERSRRIASATMEAAEAAVTLAETSLAQARAQLAYAQADVERKRTLAERGLVSQQIEEQVELAAATAQKNVDLAEATLTIRKQDLTSAQANLMEGGAAGGGQCCAIVASPASGDVLSVMTESEQVVQPGTPILEIGDPTDLEISVEVLSSDAVRIQPGAEASIGGWGGDPLRAEVTRINPTAFSKVSALGITEQRTEVVLRLLDPPTLWSRLGHGFRVVASIVIWRGRDRVLVPLGAIFRRGDDWAVFVVQDGSARLRPIALGQRSGTMAEVTDGLQPGEVVITHPGDTVADGTSVSIVHVQ
jgi:HlyD family secretion protein